MRIVLLLLTAALALPALIGGCGKAVERREPPLVVSDPAPQARFKAPSDDLAAGGPVRIAFVTHGQASSPFWAVVRNGAEVAARQLDVRLDYRAPDVYGLERMTELISQAVATRPDGLVVSVPEQGIAPAIRRAVRSGIPVVTINSGGDMFRSLGSLAHVGQPEERAGLLAGRRMARAGVRRALCVIQQPENVGLQARCRGLARAMREAGGRSTMVEIDDLDPASVRVIAEAVRSRRADGVLALNATGGLLARRALADRPGVLLGVFDLSPDVLRAVRAGDIEFAIDQQAFLQGYVPVQMLTHLARYGLFAARGGLFPTGPEFVTKDQAQRVLELSARSIR
jgi:simple sugar transport system substrate-binding protein